MNKVRNDKVFGSCVRGIPESERKGRRTLSERTLESRGKEGKKSGGRVSLEVSVWMDFLWEGGSDYETKDYKQRNKRRKRVSLRSRHSRLNQRQVTR